MSYNDLFQIDATLVANEFLDKYMPSANGDYVKVYLYLLRNRESGVDVETMAEKLELTEGDVRRAIRYWEKCGIVSVGADGRAEESSAAGTGKDKGADAEPKQSGQAEGKTDAGQDQPGGPQEAVLSGADADGSIRSRYRRTEGKDALNRLSGDAEFKQLLFIVQKYRSKILTEQEEQVLAYLYDGLGLPVDVLDYLVQYCVECGRSSMRYIEKTGLDWADCGISTVAAAQERTKAFEKAKRSSSRRRGISSDKAGITRGEDLDGWLSRMVKESIQ